MSNNFHHNQLKRQSMFANFNITHVPHDIKAIADKVAKITIQIREDLTLGIVKDAAAYIPEGEVVREALISILDIAIAALKRSAEDKDQRGITARLQAAGSDLTAAIHAETKHTISYYVICFETVFRDLFGG